MTRVLVSGGTGYVGRFIVEHLLANGYKVTVAGRTPPKPGLFSRPVAFVPLVLDPDLDQIEAFDNIYYFVHAAFDHIPGKYRGGEGNDPSGFRRSNLDGTVKLFETARDAGVRRCIFVSSRAAYGTQSPGAVLSETLHSRPETLYGEVKLQGERSLLSLCGHGFVTASLRVTGVYGAAGNDGGHKWEPLIARYLAGGPIEPRVGTEVHGRDVAKAVQILLETDAMRVNGETFNLSDILLDNRDILSAVQALTDCPYRLPEAASPLACNIMDTRKIEALGWRGGGLHLFDQTIADLALRQPVIS